MKKIITAFATDDGKTFMDRHFGDALQYEIYEINTIEIKYLHTINNTTGEEEMHADPNKAKGISGLLKKDGVQVLVSKKFGANINRMKTRFVCLLMNNSSIVESINHIQNNFERIITEWEKGERRHFLNLKN